MTVPRGHDPTDFARSFNAGTLEMPIEMGRSWVLLFNVLSEYECAADLDLSGSVGFTDLVALFAAWGACDDCRADLDGDGTVGVADVDIMLQSWGMCPHSLAGCR